MAKRFTDTELWDKEWFMKLSPKHKCLIRFIFDKCDVAGVWSPNWKLASAYIGDQVSDEDLAVFNGQLEKMDAGKYFVPDFIAFQYGQLSENCKPHQKIITLLKKYSLFERVYIPYTKGIYTLQEEEEEKDKEMEKDSPEKGSGEKPKKRVQLPANTESSLKREYEKIVEDVNGGTDIKTSWIRIKDFINAQKPSFAEPYVDLWNIFASTRNLSRVDMITAKRREKVKARTREPSFDFVRILDAIRTTDFYLGKGSSDWKVEFDYIVKSQDNYIKILERKQ